MNKKHSIKYLFLAGGYSAGPMMPLLAVAAKWHEHDPSIKPVVLDVKNSIAEHLSRKSDFVYHRIVTGKLRRYFSFKNFAAPVLLLIGFIKSLYLLRKYRPIAVLGAGGYVQIPVIVAAWILRVPRFIHQQDVAPTLSNLICAPLANLITVTFESSIRDFPQGTGLGKKFVSTHKVVWTGNPKPSVDEQKISKTAALKQFGLHGDLPVLLVIGGGTGAVGLNQLIEQGLPALTKVVQIIHGVGRGKSHPRAQTNYHPYEYIEDIDAAMSAADVVLSRAGLGALTNLAEHKKVAIIIPMPDTHQERNAELIYQRNAGIVLDQREITAEKLQNIIRELFFKPEVTSQFANNLHELFPIHADQKVYQAISKYLETNESK